MTGGSIELANKRLELTVMWDDQRPAWIYHFGAPGSRAPLVFPARLDPGSNSVNQPLQPQPLVEVLATDSGHLRASGRLVHSVLGSRLRVTSHNVVPSGHGSQILQLRQQDPLTGLEVTTVLEMPDDIAAVHGMIALHLPADRPERVVIESIALALSLGVPSDRIVDVDLVSQRSDWLAEGQWDAMPLREAGLPAVDWDLHRADPKGAAVRVSTATWSTGASTPNAFLADRASGAVWGWQVETNGAWRWEVGERRDGLYLALSGPTSEDHQWVAILEPGDSIDGVPATIVRAAGLEAAVAELTDYRRRARRHHIDNVELPVVFNDYMNTLMGDPNTEKLLPLIDAAADSGAEVFVIDAGWYDDDGDWWDSVGEWVPSISRFPAGFDEVLDRVRARGMTPGVWLEPEVIGVRSPMATELPDSAFLQRHGVRVREHDRFHLDLRDPAARNHLDRVVDRLVADFGVGYLKLDYNISGGPGTDRSADSLGAGLLAHNRAHLAWIDGLLDRHPTLILENCASGAMRQDFAMLSRMQVQSTSDQQSPLRYPPVAVAASLSMVPEQAANWAYPQPGMNAELAAFTLVTSMLGRFYLSGYLNRMTDDERTLVAEAVSVHRGLRERIRTGHGRWPLGLPGWEDPWLAFGIATDDSLLLSVWRRGGAAHQVIALPEFAGRAISVETVFPVSASGWETEWDSDTGELRIDVAAEVSARTFRLSVA